MRQVFPTGQERVGGKAELGIYLLTLSSKKEHSVNAMQVRQLLLASNRPF